MTTENMDGPVLILEDEPDWKKILEERLEEEGILTITYTDPVRAIDDIKNGLIYKTALVDLSFEGSRYSGADFFHESKRINPTIPILIISGYDGPFPWADGSFDKGRGNMGDLVRLIRTHLNKIKNL